VSRPGRTTRYFLVREVCGSDTFSDERKELGGDFSRLTSMVELLRWGTADGSPPRRALRAGRGPPGFGLVTYRLRNRGRGASVSASLNTTRSRSGLLRRQKNWLLALGKTTGAVRACSDVKDGGTLPSHMSRIGQTVRGSRFLCLRHTGEPETTHGNLGDCATPTEKRENGHTSSRKTGEGPVAYLPWHEGTQNSVAGPLYTSVWKSGR